MDDVTKESLLGALRVLIGAFAGWLDAKKYIPAENVNEIVGACMVIIPVIWTVLNKKNVEQKTQAREVVAANAVAQAASLGQIDPTVRPADVPKIIADFAPPTQQEPK